MNNGAISVLFVDFVPCTWHVASVQVLNENGNLTVKILKISNVDKDYSFNQQANTLLCMMTRSSLCVLCCLPAASMGLPAACQGLT
jgi:hypothetical protein